MPQIPAAQQLLISLFIAISLSILSIPAAQAEPSYSAADSIANADLSNQVIHARALFVSQKTKEALTDYNRIIPLLPTNPKQREKYALAFLGRADALEALGQYEKAAADAKTYFAFEPSSRWSSDRVCRMEAEGGYYKEAVANLKNYLFSTANHSGPYALLAVCSAFENDDSTSVNCLMQAINYKFSKTERKIENGPFCSEQTFVVLRNYCQTSLHSKPKDAGKHFALGMIDAVLANYKPAIEQFTDSLKLNPALWQSLTARANCYLSTGNLDAALIDVNQALESHPKEQINYATLERYYNLKGSFDAFIADLNRRIAKEPKNAQLWLAKATAYEKLTDTPKAIDAYTHAITVDPKCAEAFLKEGACEKSS